MSNLVRRMYILSLPCAVQNIGYCEALWVWVSCRQSLCNFFILILEARPFWVQSKRLLYNQGQNPKAKEAVYLERILIQDATSICLKSAFRWMLFEWRHTWTPSFSCSFTGAAFGWLVTERPFCNDADGARVLASLSVEFSDLPMPREFCRD